jgi:hypothetical protein
VTVGRTGQVSPTRTEIHVGAPAITCSAISVFVFHLFLSFFPFRSSCVREFLEAARICGRQITLRSRATLTQRD